MKIMNGWICAIVVLSLAGWVGVSAGAQEGAKGPPERQGAAKTVGPVVEIQIGDTPVKAEEIPGYAQKDPARENRYMLTMRLMGAPARGSFDAMLRDTPADVVGPLKLRQMLMRSKYVVRVERVAAETVVWQEGPGKGAPVMAPETLKVTLAAGSPDQLQEMAEAVVRVCNYAARKQWERGLREEQEKARAQLAREEAQRQERARRLVRLVREEAVLSRQAAGLPKFQIEELQRRLATLEVDLIGARARLEQLNALSSQIGHNQIATRQRDIIGTMQTLESVKLSSLAAEERALRAALVAQQRLAQVRQQAAEASAEAQASPTPVSAEARGLEDRIQAIESELRQPWEPLKMEGKATMRTIEWSRR